MNEINNSNADQILDCYADRNVVLTIEQEPAPQNEELKSYRDQLHKYFVQGVKTDFCQNISVAPILSAPCLRDIVPAMHYPVLFDWEKSNLCSLHERLEVLISNHCAADISSVLIEKLPSILLSLQGKLQVAEPELNYGFQVHELMEILGNALGDDTPKDFQKQLDPIKQKLLSYKGSIMGFGARTPFHLLHIHLKAQLFQSSLLISNGNYPD